MKLPAALLLSLVATVAGAAAQEKARPAQPDPDADAIDLYALGAVDAVMGANA